MADIISQDIKVRYDAYLRMAMRKFEETKTEQLVCGFVRLTEDNFDTVRDLLVKEGVHLNFGSGSICTFRDAPISALARIAQSPDIPKIFISLDRPLFFNTQT